MGSAMAYFWRLYTSSEALTPELMLRDLFAPSFSFKSGECKCVHVWCKCKRRSIYAFYHPNASSPVVMQMKRRWSSSLLDTQCHSGTGRGNCFTQNSPSNIEILCLVCNTVMTQSFNNFLGHNATLLSISQGQWLSTYCRTAIIEQ